MLLNSVGPTIVGDKCTPMAFTKAATTHPILSGNAYEKLKNSKLQELIVTDSIPLKQTSEKIKVLTCANLFAEVMYNVHHNKSISNKFVM